MQALGVYQAARKRGLVGFDDVPAVAATELALALGRGEDVSQVGVEIAATLTIRESTAPPKS